jgi:hypothetical protein
MPLRLNSALSNVRTTQQIHGISYEACLLAAGTQCLARYAVARVRDGRQVGAARNVNDVSSWYCQRQQDVGIRNLSEWDDDEQEWREIVVEGRWGEQVHLDQFLQAYAVERAKAEARSQGYFVTEQSLADGSGLRKITLLRRYEFIRFLFR